MSGAANDSVRDRIIEAATAEFARFGIAGARIDRLAKAARTSKERIYAYFRSKEELYEFIATRELDAVSAATELDASDLPEYAGRVHDYFVAHPDSRRLVRWGELELAETSPSAKAIAARKIATLKQAQKDGILDPSWHPLDILVMINELATAWADQIDVAPADEQARAAFLADRRQAIVLAVERLFPRRHPDETRGTVR